ncbi:MAG TPA: FecR domain-containing protein [Pedobacter sp.]|uniref:FecR family protein n=1 Tax=Pedobacter sp. TaxID=1411316 RepID=UPI002BD7B149|nr:FecR domain-containing protein [Pedobacter sp.]HMI01066.1 FecR domain-containing protein [Pedobacter sp.]
MTNEEFIILAEKVADGSASISEVALYNASYESFQQDSQSLTADGLDSKELKKESLARFWKNRDDSKRVVKLWPRFRIKSGMTGLVAAAAVAAIVFGVWFFNSDTGVPEVNSGLNVVANDIAPGKNGATITLANGRVIQLSDAKSGVVVGGGLKYSDGSDVRYSSGTSSSGSLKGSQNSSGPVGVRSLTPSELQGADGKAQILTASTAKGQTYRFTLPDGTKVWMNADSKLEFPSSFSVAGQRYVKLSGEGYFEVAKDKAHPFIVATDKQEVEVLGTHFNINSYNDEASVKTTLLEGSVRVALLSPSGGDGVARGGSGPVNPLSPQGGSLPEGERSVVLKPNQQSVLTGNVIKVRQANLEEEMAWKNGYFMFESEEIGPIMRKIARWYNLEIVYGSAIPTDKFWGTVSRFSNVSQVLKKLELTGKVHFKIEGRRITVNK